ncbi:MAG: hypothetical protein SWX82_10355 [Cyanobacteriota bacterium]|nr:hypothetical protein [Cyanobacteriota bacterium]
MWEVWGVWEYLERFGNGAQMKYFFRLNCTSDFILLQSPLLPYSPTPLLLYSPTSLWNPH